MTNFDFIGWLAANARDEREDAELEATAFERAAQIQNTYNHQYYDRPEYQNIDTLMDAPGRGDGDTYMPSEVRDYYEDSNVTNAPLTPVATADATHEADQHDYSPDELDPGRMPAFDDTTKNHGDKDYAVDLVDQEHYDDIPYGGGAGGSSAYYEHFFPVDTLETPLGGTPEGEWRFEDLDGSEPLGRDYYNYHRDSTFENDPENSYEGQLPGGYQQVEAESEHEAEYGATLQELTNPGRDSSPLDTSPETGDPGDWMGRAADMRSYETRVALVHAGTALPKIAMPMPSQLPPGWRLARNNWNDGANQTFEVMDSNGDVAAHLSLRLVQSRPKEQWQVSLSKANQEGGWGAFLYEQAMKWVSERGGWLMSDKTDFVSDSAKNVWERYHRRQDVDKKLRPDQSTFADPEDSYLRYMYQHKQKTPVTGALRVRRG